MSATTTNAQAALRAYVSRIERTQEQIDDLNTDKSEIYKEAKNEGFDVKVLKAVVAYRRKVEKQGADVIQEFDSVFELYLHALEGVGTEPALARARAQDEPPSAGAQPSQPMADKGRAHPPVAPAPAPISSPEDSADDGSHPSIPSSDDVASGPQTFMSAQSEHEPGGEKRTPSPPSAPDLEYPDLPDFLDRRKEHA